MTALPAPRVLLTGEASPVRSAVLARLLALGGASAARALDPLEDPGGAGLAGALAAADVVVHLASPGDLAAVLPVAPELRRRRAVEGVRAVLDAVAAARTTATAPGSGVRQVVLVTSAMVHGASADAPIPLAEDAPLLSGPDAGLVGDLLAVEEELRRWTARDQGPVAGGSGVLAPPAADAAPVTPPPTTAPPRTGSEAVAVLRPAALVGPGVDTTTTRAFEAPRLLAVTGSPAVWQFCHVDDLADAVAAVAAAAGPEGFRGAAAVSSPGLLTGAVVERRSGVRRLQLPAALATTTAQRLERARLLSMPATDLAFSVHPWVVEPRRLTELGWSARHSNEDCLRELMAGVRERRARSAAERTGHRREAVLGAAGAAVALVSTAAVVQRRRSGR